MIKRGLLLLRHSACALCQTLAAKIVEFQTARQIAEAVSRLESLQWSAEVLA